MFKREKQARISRYRWTVKIASVPIGAGTKSILKQFMTLSNDNRFVISLNTEVMTNMDDVLALKCTYSAWISKKT
jgi:hypothetical protein